MATTEFDRQFTLWKRKKRFEDSSDSYKEKIEDQEWLLWLKAEARTRVEAKLARGRMEFNTSGCDHNMGWEMGRLEDPLDVSADIASPDSEYCSDHVSTSEDEARGRSLSEISVASMVFDHGIGAHAYINRR